jgi:winged helix DNA-binding protein
MGRQLLDPVGSLTVAGVVRRLCGVQAQVASSAELAVRVRRKTSRRGEVARALAEGRVIKTWAMRGTLHLLTPEEGGAFLSLIAAGRSWETPAWERYFGLGPKQIEGLRHVVREALDGKVLTREELIAAVIAQRGFGHVGEELRSGWGTLLKPLAWQGDLCFGASRGNRVTFMRPGHASSRWAGIPDPDEAAPTAIAAYFGAYGPATIENFRNWVSRGRVSVRRIRGWFSAMGERLAEVDVDGERRYILAKHLDELASARPSKAVRLLPAFDQYVLGPGTEDHHVVPATRRTSVSRQAGWIAPIVVAGGVVSGTWELDGERARIAWFKEAGNVPKSALEAEVARLSTILDRDLRTTITLA